MKYIRTKNCVCEVGKLDLNELLKTLYGCEVRLIEYDIVKQADTIKELCDGFYVQIDDWHFDTTHLFDNLEKAIEDFEDWQSYSDRKGLEYKIEVYAFIKTDKGLIYVAKLNNKGELELL